MVVNQHMLILFPHQPFASKQPDFDFVDECSAARTVGFETAFYNHEAVDGGEITAAVKDLPKMAGHPRPAILRGWMLPGERYKALFEALWDKGYALQTVPQAYNEAHYFPLAYPHLTGATARSAWITGDDAGEAWKLYQDFRHGNALIKDWVKSAKNRWQDGCFLPANTSEERFREIFAVFRSTRGKLFNRGVVIKEFMPIVQSGTDLRGFPLVDETRLFFWRGQILVEPSAAPPSALTNRKCWETIAEKFKSPFITIDVAYLTDGSWKIIEVGDGGVSGLPVGLDPARFYERLSELMNPEG